MVAVIAAVIAPITARAAEIPVIRIFPPACEASPVSVDDFIESLRVELAGRQPHCCVVGPGGDAAADAVKVTLVIEPCDPATPEIGVRVDVTQPPRTMQRQVALADLPPEARPRALALAVAELIRTAGEPAPAAAPVPDEQRNQGFGQRFDVMGSVAGAMQHHFKHGTTLWGARLGITVSSGRWRAALDAGAATNHTAVSIGSVSILLASAALFAGPRFDAGPVVVGFGPTAALGWARIKGQSTDPSVGAGEGTGLVATAGVRAAVEGPAGHLMGLVGWLEAGVTVRRLDADVQDQPAAGISGPYILLAAGVKFGPS
jgi:hypothetical protein